MKKNIFFTLIIFVFLLAGCSKNSKNNKETVVFNLGSDYNTLDPHLFTEMIAVQVDSSIYEGLLRLDEKGNYTGGVAKSFKESGNKLIFKLRDNAKWSNGQKIVANDFVFAFKRVLNPKVAAQFSEMLFPIKNAEKLDDFLFNGPYKITKLQEEEILLEKNEDYWNVKNIKIPKIKYVISKDFRVVDDLIKNKEIDMSRVEPYSLSKYKKNKVLDTYFNGRVWYLDFNLSNKYLKNSKLRKAISIVIDRKKYVNEIKKDGSIVAKSIISNEISGYSKKYRESYPDKDYFKDNDIKTAKKLYLEALKELGVNRLRLRLLSGNSDPEVKEIQFIQEELRTKLGLETDVSTVPFKERLSKTRSGDYDIVLNTWSPKYDDALSYLDRWKKDDNLNMNVWSKAKYNALVTEISKIPSSKERDKKINEAERILIDENVISPLYFSVENHYRNPKIKDVVRRSVTGIADFTYAHF